MTVRLFLYKIKCMMGDPGRLFWVLLFPILLGTLFSFTFGTLLNDETDDEPIKTAVAEEKANPHFKTMLEYLSGESPPLLDVLYTDGQNAERMLKDGEVAGIFYIDDEPSLTVNERGIEPTILSEVLSRYVSTEAALRDILSENSDLNAEFISEITQSEDYVANVNLNASVNGIWRENFYALIAMTCLYGGFFGLTSASELKAGESAVGARLQSSPVAKSRLIISDCLAMTAAEFAISAALLAYLNFALKVDLGDSTGYMLLSCLCGSFCGVMLGMFAGVALNTSAALKDAVLVGVSLGLCFLSGLMYPSMRLLVEHSAPFINRVNPAALIVDSLYALDAYGAGERYFADVALLIAIGVIFTALSVLILRRNRNGGSY